MKKLLTIAFAAATMLSVSAKESIVYSNGACTSGITPYGWWNVNFNTTATDPTGGNNKVFSFQAADGGAAASMGLFADGTEFVTGPLHSATLNFGWYALGTGKYTIRLTADTGKEENYDFEVTDENAGRWNTVSLPVATTFPTVSQQWNDYVGKGAGYVFSVILSEGSADAVIYIDEVIYSNIDEAWTAPELPELVPPTSIPAPAHPEADVLSVFSSYGKMNYNIGGWGQATQISYESIDGREMAKLVKFNYLGWEFPTHFSIADYDYMHVDFYPCEQTGFGFTPISPGAERGWIAPEVKLNEWNSYDAPISYFNNVDLADIFQIKFDQGTIAECYLANVYFWKDSNKKPDVPAGEAEYSGTVSNTYSQTMDDGTKEYPYTLNYTIYYNADKTLTIKADFEWVNGEPVGMIPGSVFVNNILTDFTLADGVRTATTTETYERGQTIPVNVYLPVALGVVEIPFEYTVGSDNKNTGIDTVDSISVSSAAPAYYTLQGVRVANPSNGIYIRVENGKARKVMVK